MGYGIMDAMICTDPKLRQIKNVVDGIELNQVDLNGGLITQHDVQCH